MASRFPSPEGSRSSADAAGPSRSSLYKPDPRECALLLLRMLELKQQEGMKGGSKEKEISRLRITEISLRRLWSRRRLSPDFVEEVADWLSSAGFTLFFAGATYGLIRTAVVESWVRVTSKRMAAELSQVARGAYDFSAIEYLLPISDQDAGDDEERDTRPGRE